MVLGLFRRVIISKQLVYYSPPLRQCCAFSSRGLPFLGNGKGDGVANYGNKLHLSPLFGGKEDDPVKDCKIELVDDDAWRVSSSLVSALRGDVAEVALERRQYFLSDQENNDENGMVNDVFLDGDDPDIDEIEDMRIRGNLFYKIDKQSKEYEEYKFDFHGRKSSKVRDDENKNKGNKEKENPSAPSVSSSEKMLKIKDERREIKNRKENKAEKLLGRNKDELLVSQLHELGGTYTEKPKRTPTFNQLTAPYHEPFCLDIYVSKGSVRGSIIHRATSKVVVVAHSISKDLKFELGSTKSRNACAAVGKVLAQRALDDDIHNVVYTPRKGDKIEGKLEIVLNSVIDKGINVKVKLKQQKSRQGKRASFQGSGVKRTVIR